MGDKKENIGHEAQKKELYVSAADAFEAAKVLATHPRDRERIELFKGTLVHSKHLTLEDRLPYLAIRETNSKIKSKIGCVFALMCAISQLYDRICRNEINRVQRLQGYIKRLDTITKAGLISYEVGGDVASGYYLRKKNAV